MRVKSLRAYPKAAIRLQLPLGPRPSGHPHSAECISPDCSTNIFISEILVAVMKYLPWLILAMIECCHL